jgi:RNA polymerase sigma-70 factor (ECF subfamily)
MTCRKVVRYLYYLYVCGKALQLNHTFMSAPLVSTNSSDSLLIQRMKAGDIDALLEIRDRHYKYLLVQAYHLTQCEHESRDVVQECFIDFWERRNSLNDLQFNIPAYLGTAIRHRSLDHLRKVKTRRNHVYQYASQQSHSYFPDPAANNELRLELHNAIQSLPAQQLKVFVGKYIEGKRYKEISACTGITEHTVRSYLAEAMKRLRVKLIHLK